MVEFSNTDKEVVRFTMSKKKQFRDDSFREENRKRKNLFKQQKRRELEESIEDDLEDDYEVYKFLREKK